MFCEDKEIIFSFNGKISNSILQGIISILEERLSDYNIEKNSLKKIISIIIELTQNIQRYSFRKTGNRDKGDGYGMLVVRKTEEGFEIYAGNLLIRESAETLIRSCRDFMKYDQAVLREMYQNKLQGKRPGATDGAGLGLISILRKSNSRMKIHSHKVDDAHVFLAFLILVT
jgi:hypothetical protein